MPHTLRSAAVASCLLAAIAVAAPPSTHPAPPKVETRTWTVDGTKRTGIVVTPPLADGATKRPIAFIFHGHGGSGAQIRRRSDFDSVMPAAITVYLDGLPTKSHYDPDGTRRSWQQRPGDEADRDLHFFDAVWTDLKRDPSIDIDHVYAYGHSNGGLFVFVLWAARGEVLHAVATSGSLPLFAATRLSAKPALHIAGTADPLAPFAGQERWINAGRKIDGCAPTSQPWAERGAKYESAGGTPFYTIVHDGGHEPPVWSPGLIAKFFDEVK